MVPYVHHLSQEPIDAKTDVGGYRNLIPLPPEPVVIQSEGKDVDRAALDAVLRWRFSPAKCGKEAIEAKVQLEVIIRLK